MRVFRLADLDERGRDAALREAADMLRDGKLVAFPTETVYGLGANALDADAVQRIYEAKGRPARNPIIVHVADVAAARSLARDWPDVASRVAHAFWPGPVTLVVKKADAVPDVVTAGHDSIGLRVPSHPVALDLLRLAGVPVAAPSANPSTHVSPTSADHVLRALEGRIDALVDGGPTEVGIESAVLDLTSQVPRVLRPGMISAEDITRALGTPVEGSSLGRDESTPVSPGQFGKHYAPRARIILGDRDELSGNRAREGALIGAIVFESIGASAERVMPRNPSAYASALYAALHDLDERGCSVILIEKPPKTTEWLAIIDRLSRAAR